MIVLFRLFLSSLPHTYEQIHVMGVSLSMMGSPFSLLLFFREGLKIRIQ